MTLTHEQVMDLAAAYVLGVLEPDEEQAVREHLASCELPHDELAELGGVVPYLAETVDQVEPPAGLKARIMAAAADELAARGGETSRPTAEGGAAVAPPPSAEPTAPPSVTAFPTPAERETRRSRTSPSTWVLRIAAVLVIAVLGGYNLLLQGQLNAARDYDRAVAAVLDLAARPGSQSAILSGSAGAGPRGLAAIGADGTIRIAMRDLAPTSGTQVYEAWVIAPGAPAPVPIGGFTASQNGVGSISTIATAGPGVTIALTREPGPGATTPTPPILSTGVATAPPSG
jgi:anti-sigma factor RsiW